MSRKVLVIDDAEPVRQWLSKLLSEAGFQVVQAIDGIEGAKQIRAHADLAVVLCDINLPRLNGLDMLESIQQEIAEKDLKVVVLTSDAGPDSILRGKRAGVKGWFIKPLKGELLVAALQKLSGVQNSRARGL
ncbi:MAG TPA: response regulator [Polyangiaceae bacterium]